MKYSITTCFSALLLALSPVLTSCQNKEETKPAQEDDRVIVVQTTDGKDLNDIALSYKGESFGYVVNTKKMWSAEVDADWAKMGVSSGFGRSFSSLVIQANPFPEKRECTVVVKVNKSEETWQFKITQEGSTNVHPSHCRDLMLYYCGVTEFRDFYSKEVFLDYIITDEAQPRWAFDSALLLEIWKDYDHSASYMGDGYSKRLANKQEITDLIDTWMGTVLPRLEAAVSDAKKLTTGSCPKHKVVCMIPILPYLTTNDEWGDIPGLETHNWNKWDNVLEVYKWEVELIISRFLSKDFKNLELVGLYWPVENAGIASFLLTRLSEYVQSRNLEMYFIPYYSDSFVEPIYSMWQKFGFDHCYLQPNYFFHDNIPYSRLEQAIAYAKKYNMDMEFEFDVASKPKWGYRMDDYIKAFEEGGIWENNDVAYYAGGKNVPWLKAQKTSNPANYNLYRKLMTIVADRHEKEYGN